MANIGLNVEFPKSKQKAHTIVMEIKQNPAKGIKYSWAYPKKTNNKYIFTHSRTNKFDLLEAFDYPFLTQNRWIYILPTIEFALNFKLDGYYYKREKRIGIIHRILKKDNLKKLIFFSKSGQKTLSNYAHINDKEILNKTTTIYNAVPDVKDSLLTKKNKEKFRILFLGTAFHLKGGDALVDAFEILQKKYPFIELEIHSSLMKKNYLNTEVYQPLDHNKTIEKIKNNKSIFHYDSFKLSRKDILKKIYPRANLFILPSLQEGMPYVVQEAMAYGLPIVSTNCTASIPEIVEDPKNGLIIDVQNNLLKNVMKNINPAGKRIISKEFHDYLTKEIVKKLSRIIEDDNLRKLMRKNNLKKARDLFSFEKRNKIMKRIYQEAI